MLRSVPLMLLALLAEGCSSGPRMHELSGTVTLDGVEHRVRKGSIVHIPPGVVQGARGRMRVVGIPDISEGDLYFKSSVP